MEAEIKTNGRGRDGRLQVLRSLMHSRRLPRTHADTRAHTQYQVHPQAEDPHVKVRESLKIAALSWALCFVKPAPAGVCIQTHGVKHTRAHIHSKKSGITKHAVCENKGKVLGYRNGTRGQSCWLITSCIQTQQNHSKISG